MSAGVVMKDPYVQFSNMRVYIVLANSFSFKYLNVYSCTVSADYRFSFLLEN